MKIKLLAAIAGLLLMAIANASAQCTSGCSITLNLTNGSSTTQNISFTGPNQTYCIVVSGGGSATISGGSINFDNRPNATLCIGEGVTIGSGVNLNNIHTQTDINNYGILQASLTLNGNQNVVNNYGTISGPVSLNANNATINNMSGATFSSSNFTHNNGNFVNNTGANFNLPGNYTNNGSFTGGGSFTVNGNFSNGSGATTNIGGPATITGSLTANHPITFGSNLQVNGNLTTNSGGPISVSGALSVNGNVQANNPITASSTVNIGGNFTVNNGGGSNFSGATTIGGATQINAPMTFGGPATLNGSLTTNSGGNTNFNGGATISGSWTNNATVNFTGVVSVSGSITNNSGGTIQSSSSACKSLCAGSITNSGTVRSTAGPNMNVCVSFSGGTQTNLTTNITPTANASGFSASATGGTINGSFTHASPLPGGYLVLRKTGADFVSADLPQSNTTYTVGATIGSATVIAILNNSTNSFSNTPGACGNYYFAVVSSSNNTGTCGTYRTSSYASTGPVSITSLVTATISYTGSPWCQSAGVQNVTRTGTAGGTYTATPAGLSINSSSGQITPSTSSPNTYTVSYTLTSPGCSDFVATANVTINATPTVTGTTPGSRCGTGTVVLSGTASSGATLDWYAAATGGSPLAGGTGTLNFTTPSISGTTTYFAQARNTTTGCISTARTAVTATINPLPTVTGTTGGSRCGTGTVNLSGTASAGATLDWYDAATGGNLLASGTLTFTTPIISSTTNFFAQARNTTTGCPSAARTSVTATVNPFPVVGALTGYQGACIGSTTLFSTTTGGGVWSTDNAAIATVSGGIVTGMAAGTSNINYTVTSGAGCQTTVSRAVTVFNPAPGTPGTYGDGQWIGYAYNSLDFSTNYAGYYTTGSALSYNTTTDFGTTAPPSAAATYQGCAVNQSAYSLRLMRTNFTPGTYQIDVNNNDDGIAIILNGTTIYSFPSVNSGLRTNVWTGPLGPTSQLEVRYNNSGSGPAFAQFTITAVTNNPPNPGVISGNQVACDNQTPVNVLGNVTAPTAGTCTNLTPTIQWESSTDNISFLPILGANATSYTIPGPLTQTTYFRRAFRTWCETVYSNTATVTVYNGPQGNPNDWGTGQWNAYVYNSMDFSSNYSGFYTTASALSYQSTTDYVANGRPSSAPTYQGCQIGNTQYSIRYKRTGFAWGRYQIDIPYNDDGMDIILNGSTVYSMAGFNTNPRTNVWTGTLGPNSELEIRFFNNNGPGEIRWNFTLLSSITASQGGVISGNQVACSGQVPVTALGNVSAAVQGSCTVNLNPTASAQVPYQWQSSTDNVLWTDISGANAITYTIPVALTQTTHYRRMYRTYCDTVPSNTVTVTVHNGAQGNPSDWGIGQWNAYVYNSMDYSSDYSGFYTTASALIYQSTTDFVANGRPSSAPTYQGCQIGNTQYSIRYKRTGFAWGRYQIDIPYNDDGMDIILNGSTVYSMAGFNPNPRTNVWTGTLGPDSELEIRFFNNNGPGEIRWNFTLLPVVTPAQPGTIAGNQSICSGQTPAIALTNITAGSIGSCTQLISNFYQWQISTDNTNWSNISGANAAGYTIPGPLTQTTYYRRLYRTYCDTLPSNAITIQVFGGPQGTPGVHGVGQWNAYVYTGTDYTTGYSGWFTTNTALTQNTVSYYNVNQPPSHAPTYLGCQIPAQPYSVRFQRTGIPYGLYSIGMARNDDQVQILIDGVVAYTAGTNTIDRPNVWVGTIYPTTLVEIRYNNTGGPGDVHFYFNNATFTTAAIPGVIAGDQSLCAGQTPAQTFANVSAGSAGSCTQVASATNLLYQWQQSTNNLTWTNIAGAQAASYTHPTALTQTTYFRRAYRTYCDTVFSNVVTATVYGGPQGTPNTFGNGLWNAYVYNATDYTSNYSGFYTTGAGLTYNTLSDFANNLAPSMAPNYQGCQVNPNLYSVRFQRTGFPLGVYRIGVDINDDGMDIILNGVIVYTSGSFTNTVRPNVWTGTLGANSNLEIRYRNTVGVGQISWNFTLVTNSPATLAGSISGPASLCSGLTAALTSSAAATVGTCTPLVSNAYQWQASTDNISFANISGANGLTYTSMALTQTTYFRRVYRTYCDTVFSNVVTVIVNPRPAMTSSNAISVCHNTQVGHALTASIPSTFSWIATANGNVAGESLTTQSTSTINDLLVLNIPANGTTVTYTITPTAIGTGCVGTAQTLSVTVNPAPTMTSASSLNRCNGLAVNLNFTSNIASSYNWVANDNGNVSGESLTLQTGATLTDVLTSSATTNQVVSYLVTPIHGGNGCAGATQTVNVTVFPTATMTSANALTRCSGVATGLPLTSNVSGTTYSWIATDNPSTTGESLTTQTAATLNNTITNVSGVAQDVLYTITPITSGALACPGNPQTLTVTVNPAPIMTSANSFQACNNSVVGFNLTANPAATFSWIATANGNVAGESNSSPQSGSTITDLLVLNNNFSVTSVVYTVTPTAIGTGCVGPNQTLIVNVNSLPVMTSSATGTICSGTTFTRTLTSNPASTYSWVATENVNVSGESLSPQTGSPLSNTLINLTQSVQTVTYTVTPTNPLGSCVGTAQTLTVTLNPAPVLTNALSFERCNNVAIGVGLTANPASSFSWIATSNPDVTGESLTTQTGATINNTLVLANNLVPTTVQYNVTPTASSTGCVGATTAVQVNVNSTPAMTSASSGSVCTGETLNFGLTANVASSFSWVAANNVNVTGESLTPQSGAVLNNTLVNGVGTPQNVVYTVTPSNLLGSCVGSPQNVTITVNPNVGTPSAPSGTITFCQGSTIPFSTSALYATGYSWSVTGAGNTISGSGSTANALFDSNFSGPATVSVQALGCGGPSATASTNVTVNPSGQWLGLTNNWNTASNWCGGVPSPTTNVIIPTAAVNMPQINAASFANNIQLQTGTSLTINGANSLTISGMFTNLGTFAPSAVSTVTYNGDAAQHVVAANYGHLTTAGNGSKTLLGTIGIAGTFSPGGASHLAGTSTVHFNGSAPQNIPTFNFYNLSTSGNNAKTLTGTVSVDNQLILTNGTLGLANQSLTLSGNISGAGTLSGTCASTLIIAGAGNTGTLNFTSGSRVLGYLNLSKTAAGLVNLGTDLDICSQLNLTQGKVVIGSNNLTLLPGASTTAGNANSYVQTLDQSNPSGAGFLIQEIPNGAGELTFPVGTAESFTPAYLDNIGFTRNFKVRVFNNVYEHGTHGIPVLNSDFSVLKTWEIEPIGTGGTPDVSIKLQWNPGDEGQYFAANRLDEKIYMGKNTGVGNSLWSKLLTDEKHLTAAPFTLSTARVTSFSKFAIGSDEAPLPVTLGRLSVESKAQTQVLRWKTFMERDALGFEVYRSTNGIDYQQIGFVKANGTPSDYQFVHPATARANYYFKIRFVGQASDDVMESNVVLVRNAWDGSYAFYPNPVENQCFIEHLNWADGDEVEWQITDLKGAILLNAKTLAEQGKVNVNLQDLPTGLYFLEAQCNGFRSGKQKVVKN